MRFGLSLPIFDDLADPAALAHLAAEAEAAGWDGVFLWDHVHYRPPTVEATDPWIALAAIAARTTHLTFGPMVTPLARRRPQVLARQVVALDRLSGGRMVLGVGLGLDSSGGEFSRFGEETDDKRRAEVFDEALGLVTDLLSGNAVDHDGRHFTARNVRFLPGPVNGHVPVWVAARWPHVRPIRRAARHDGLYIIDLEPADLRRALDQVAAARPGGLVDYAVAVHARPGTAVEPWERAGATWWLAKFDSFTVHRSDVQAVIASGPPR